MLYFSHDTGAANDPKIEALRVECKGGAVDAYWAILETIYREEGPYDLLGNQAATKALAHKLATSVPTLVKWVDKMVEIGLFHIVVENEKHGKGLYSKRCEETIEAYNRKRETARQNGKLGGLAASANRTATKPLSDSLAKKRKEKKEKEKEKERQPVGSVAAGAAPPVCEKCGGRIFHAVGGTDFCLDCGKAVR